MNQLHVVLQNVELAAFTLLGLVAIVHWRRHPGPASGWLAATLGSFAAVAAISVFVPEDLDDPATFWAAKLLFVVLAMFPYFLFRFMSTFVEQSKRLDRVAKVMTGIVAAATLLLPDAPGPDEPLTPPFVAFLVVFLTNWVLLSSVVAVRLWQGGKGQPGVARRRMRILSLGTLGLALALLISGVSQSGEEATPASIATQVIALTTAPLFLLGFAPPRLIRLAWRRKEELALRTAELELMKALDSQHIADIILPSMCALVGGEAAILRDTAGQVVGSYVSPAPGSRAHAASGTDKRSALTVKLRDGDIVVYASPFTPFFGSEEAQTLQSLGVLADLALARAELFQAEQRKNAYLRILQQVTSSANAPDGPQAAIQTALDIVCAETWWSSAHAFLAGQDQGAAPTRLWHLDPSSPLSEEFRMTTQNSGPGAGDGEAAKVFETGESVWVADLAEEPRFLGRSPALHGAAAVVPIRVGSEIVGVLVFHAEGTREQDLEMLNVLTQIGVQLGRTVERTRNQEQLRKRAEDLARSNADLEQFAYVASHDLQEPLRMVNSYMQLLQERYEDELDETAQRYIHYAVDGATRMQSLVRDLLTFSRVGSRGAELVATDLNRVLDETLANFEVAIKESGAVVTADPLPVVKGDHAQLTQLLQNLIGNAIKFHSDTQPEVRISATREPAEWVIRVADNGVGFDQKYAERVFVIFKRLHARDQYQGTGIGLAIAKKIVERHGGRIWADSEEGRGTTISFTLPAAQELAA